MSIKDFINDLNAGKCFSDKFTPTLSYKNPYDIKELAQRYGLGELALDGCRMTSNMWNGGNQWSGWVSYLTFFRYVIGVNEVDYTQWDPYEQLAKKSGPRVMHEDFCIISDRYSTLKLDDQNRPHCEDGPFATWSDGSALYSHHNVRVPLWILDNPEKITVADIENENNLEVRRVMTSKYGQERYIIDSKAEIVHSDDFGILYRKDVPGDEIIMMVKVVNSTQEPDGTFKDYWIRVDPNAYGGLKTAQAAVASTWRKSDGSMVFEKPEDYVCEIET